MKSSGIVNPPTARAVRTTTLFTALLALLVALLPSLPANASTTWKLVSPTGSVSLVHIDTEISLLSTVITERPPGVTGGEVYYEFYLDDEVVRPPARGHGFYIPHDALGKVFTAKVYIYHDGELIPMGTWATATVTRRPMTKGSLTLPYFGVGDTAYWQGMVSGSPSAPNRREETGVWYLDGVQVATGKNYTIPASARGKTLSVKVRTTADMYEPLEVTLTAPEPIGNRRFSMGAVDVEGTIKAGQTLTFSPPPYYPTDASTTEVKWYVDDVLQRTATVAGGGTDRFTLTNAMVNKTLRVDYRIGKSGYDDLTRSQTFGPIAGLSMNHSHTLTGSMTPGNSVTLNVTSDAPGWTATYQWFADDELLPTTSKTLAYSDALKAKAITVGYTITAPNYTTVRVDPVFVTYIDGGVYHEPRVWLDEESITSPGGTLIPRASATGMTPQVEWSWSKRDIWGNTIHLATSPTYSPKYSDAGAYITATGKFISPGYEDYSARFSFSISTIQVTAQGLTDGKAVIGKLISASVPTPIAGSSIVWERTRSLTVVSRKSSYAPTNDDLGYPLSVRARVISPDGDFTVTDLVNFGGVLHEMGDTKLSFSTQTPAHGTPVTVTASTPAPEPVYRTFTWRLGSADGEIVSDEATYSPAQSHGGQTVHLTVTLSKNQYATRTLTASLEIALTTFTDQVSVDHDADRPIEIGQKLMPVDAPDVDNLEVTYEWSIGGGPGFEAATLTPTAVHAGQQVLVRTRYSAPGFAPLTTSWEWVGEVERIIESPSVSLDGTPGVGQVLAAGLDTPTPGISASIEWRAGSATGAVLASGPTFTPSREHAGATVVIVVDGHATGYRAVRLTHAVQIPLIEFDADLTTDLTPGARIRPGKVLTTAATTDVSDADITYQWRAGSDVVGSQATLKAGPAHVGQNLQVCATLRAAGYQTLTTPWLTVGLVEAGSLGRATLAVTGTPLVGKTLKVTASTATRAQTTTVTWLRNGEKIATGTRYKFTAKDAGRRLSVVATFDKPGYQRATTQRSTSKIAWAAPRATLNKSKVKAGSPVTLKMSSLRPGTSSTVILRGKTQATIKVSSSGKIKVTKKKARGVKVKAGKKSVSLTFAAPSKQGKHTVTIKTSKARSASVKLTVKP